MPVLVTFADASAAARPVAGVATAARVVAGLARAGHGPLWLAVPGGGPLPERCIADIERLANGSEVAVVDGDALEAAPIGEAAIDRLVVLPAPRLSSRKILRATAKRSDGPVARWLNRPISQFISAWLLLFPGVRPIHATIGTALLAAAMFAALVLGGAFGLIAGGLLFQASSVFDGVDGEIARATFRTSAAGAALDTMVDVATNFAFILGVTVNLTLREGSEAALIGGWGFGLFLLGIAVSSWAATRREEAFHLNFIKRRFLKGGITDALIGFLATVSSRDFFALLFALLILGGAPMAVLAIFALAATIWMPFVLAGVLLRHEAAAPPRSA